MQRHGSAGGRATVEKLGRQHMAEIGRRGFKSFTDRYFDGDRDQAMSYLRRRAYERQAESFADRELARRIENGERTACVELPVVEVGDEVPF